MSDDLPLGLALGVTLHFELEAGERRVILRAPDLGQALQLDAFGAAIVERLDGSTSTSDVLDAPEIVTPGDRARARQLLARLESLRLVGTDLAAERLAAQAEDKRVWLLQWGQLGTVNVQNLDDDQLTQLVSEAPDSNCADCQLHCCSYNVSIAKSEVMTICKAAITHGLRPADIFYPGHEQPEAHLGMVAMRHNDSGSCVFLDANTRCLIHASAGLAHKPSACQLYPGLPILSEDGGRLGLRMGCAHAKRDTSALGAAAFREMLERIRNAAPNLVFRKAPASVHMLTGTMVPWSAYVDWEREALAAIQEAPTALTGLDQAISALYRRWGAPPTLPGAVVRMAQRASAVFVELDLHAEAEILRQIADGPEEGFDGRPLHNDQVSQVVQSLEPLRFDTVLAGLGVFRLMLRAAERDPEATLRPRETAARWFRRLEKRGIRLEMAESETADLEALAAPS